MKKGGYFNCKIDKVKNIKSKQLAILSVPTITHYKKKKITVLLHQKYFVKKVKNI